ILGCTATDQMMIVVNPADTTSIDGIVNICFDSNTQLSAITNNALSYLWSNGATTSSIGVSAANTYTVTVTNPLGCISTASATVTVQDIVANLTGDTEICEGETTTLSLADSYSQYLWSNNATTATLNTNGGTYSVTVTDANDCSTITSITIIENPNPTPSIIGEHDIPEFTSTTWSVSPTFPQYIWSNSATTPSITVAEEETYSVTVTDANDCKGTAAAILDLIPSKAVLFPSAFSPNNDSVNDDFGATTKNVISYSVEIFNRWGQRVFSSDNINQRWDGTYKGVAQEMGVYVYQGKVIYADNTEEAFKGNVSLVR
ncbi:MAG TPA: gliding motility-associated C-terminal domain-containing protein, partial [Chitinophagales bacterium]|nr:gliding motility-associated C-terminal domain-containing protein [Chitinophagales bacterium]